MTFDFHTRGLDTAIHPYQSNPLGWLVLDRPVGVDAQNDLPAASCGAAADSSCIRVVTILGNPAVWWTGAAATLGSIVAWIVTRQGRWAVPVVGVLSGWLPWFLNDDRPIFSFYAVTVLPFMIIAIAMLGDLAYRSATSVRGRYVVMVLAGRWWSPRSGCSATSTRSSPTSWCPTTPGTAGCGRPDGSSGDPAEGLR